MVHRIYKETVPKTNKVHLLRDLIIYENDMQALRFMAERIYSSDGAPISIWHKLFSGGIFRSSYFESTEQRQSRANALSGDSDFTNVYVKGRPWSSARTASSVPGFPASHLNDYQMTELAKAYEALGIRELNLNPAVKFYSRISYRVRGTTDTAVSSDTTYQHIKVTVGDIVECAVDAPDAGREFARVVGIMVHEKMAFFVLTWFASTGRLHPRLKLAEFKETTLYNYTAFHPISIVDHPRFINRVHFTSLEGSIWLNEWVFFMV